MSIPDEVAQYAEGHRITAYLRSGRSEGQGERTRLCTTGCGPRVSSGQFPYEFDSFRVFVWSTRRHHYETAYIERNVKGHYPVTAEDRPGQDEKAFSLVLEDKDGRLYKRTYAFSGYHVSMISKVPYQPPPPLPEVHDVRNFDPLPPPTPAESAWREKLDDWRIKLFRR